ncbi:GAF domain-containing protein [Rhodococcus sp. HNM0569]|uniref:GAF domain-containing protein n=1 Tax=Rhodococcus sp. HNM0569 TaxID=2716340 RepID=UPI00146F28CB|nr:GAF domain-containing protein [Rhodococcus sp. HNM0569]NLU82481.1 transcriptional regulator [Rhodococcus sp. HNM0569]
MARRAPVERKWALPPGTDSSLLAAATAHAHRSFITSTDASPDVRGIVRESWVRSRLGGVDPDSTATAGLPSDELARYRRTHPLASALPVVRTLLVDDVADTGMLVALSDAQGRLLWVDGDHRALDDAATMNFAEGSDWSEAAVGTNAPGTSLALDRGVQIFGAEHFSRSVHDWSCTAVPVHDPADGRLLGALDITGGSRVAAPEFLSLVRATVAAVEAHLRVELVTGARTQPNAPTLALEVLGARRPALVRGGERITLSQRHAEIVLLLTRHPSGLSADQLAYLLDDADLDPVTVRAEVSRLRRLLGADLLASRPYRLTAPVRVDVDDVSSCLDRGDVTGALAAYAGAVLPASDAPGVRDIRADVTDDLRVAVLRSRDAAALGHWTATVEGADDLDAWHAYVAALAPGSPRRVRAQARLARLDERLSR